MGALDSVVGGWLGLGLVVAAFVWHKFTAQAFVDYAIEAGPLGQVPSGMRAPIYYTALVAVCLLVTVVSWPLVLRQRIKRGPQWWRVRK